MAITYSYLFEAKGIQRYIMDSGRLADLVGASEMIAELCNSDGDDLLNHVLDACGSPNLQPSRRAGGSLCLHSHDKADLNRVRALWRLAIGMRVPGMPFTDCDPVAGTDAGAALKAAYKAQPGLRENSAAFLLPIGGPMTEFNPRTGRVATEMISYHSGDTVVLDAVTKPQRKQAKGETGRLARKFLPKDENDAAGYLFPLHFETAVAGKDHPAFPFGKRDDRTGKPGDARIAVIHADVSGLGQVFRDITEKTRSADEVFNVAKAIEKAIEAAARAASGAHLLPFSAAKGDKGSKGLFGKDTDFWPDGKKLVPARPVLLGGDDITIITRADLALRFTEALLLGIEDETAKAFRNMAKGTVPVPHLTACAGIAIVGSGHPFLAAHNMAEGMCKLAKKKGKTGIQPPYNACLTFAVITSTIDEDFKDDYREREQKTADDKYLNGGPYLVTAKDQPGETVPNLMALATALKGSAGYGKLIAALGLRHESIAAPKTIWKRYWEVLKENEESDDAVRGALECLEVPTDTDDLPVLDVALPLLNDALELAEIGAVIAAGHEP